MLTLVYGTGGANGRGGSRCVTAVGRCAGTASGHGHSRRSFVLAGQGRRRRRAVRRPVLLRSLDCRGRTDASVSGVPTTGSHVTFPAALGAGLAAGRQGWARGTRVVWPEIPRHGRVPRPAITANVGLGPIAFIVARRQAGRAGSSIVAAAIVSLALARVRARRRIPSALVCVRRVSRLLALARGRPVPVVVLRMPARAGLAPWVLQLLLLLLLHGRHGCAVDHARRGPAWIGAHGRRRRRRGLPSVTLAALPLIPLAIAVASRGRVPGVPGVAVPSPWGTRRSAPSSRVSMRRAVKAWRAIARGVTRVARIRHRAGVPRVRHFAHLAGISRVAHVSRVASTRVSGVARVAHVSRRAAAIRPFGLHGRERRVSRHLSPRLVDMR